MGDIANKYCDKIYLTDDNPRFENPKVIRDQIKRKLRKNILKFPHGLTLFQKLLVN